MWPEDRHGEWKNQTLQFAISVLNEAGIVEVEKRWNIIVLKTNFD